MNLPLELPTRSALSAVSKQTQDLFRQLEGKFNDNIMREILLASCGLKVARTCMSDDDLRAFLPVVEQSNLKIALSSEKYLHRKDIGKGGWSNSLEGAVPPDHPGGLFNVYIATDEYLADLGLKAEERSYQDEFGLLLGIPECCRDAYVRAHPVARVKQNDLIPIVLDNTTGPTPYNSWNNYVSQYFGRTLLSFFPCSFNCPLAAEFAQKSFTLLQQFSRSWAMEFIKLQRTNILYTEYLGLHLFRSSFYSEGWMNYDPALIESTEVTEISECLGAGDRLKVLDRHGIEVYDGKRFVNRLQDEDISLCLFVGKAMRA